MSRPAVFFPQGILPTDEGLEDSDLIITPTKPPPTTPAPPIPVTQSPLPVVPQTPTEQTACSDTPRPPSTPNYPPPPTTHPPSPPDDFDVFMVDPVPRDQTPPPRTQMALTTEVWPHDTDMLPTTAPNTAPTCRANILAHLAAAASNGPLLRSSACANGPAVPYFTPTPAEGFPAVHLSHAAQLLDHIDQLTICNWLDVPDPKLIVHPFDFDGKDHTKTAITAELLKKAVATVTTHFKTDTRPARISPPFHPLAPRSNPSHS